MMIEEKFNLKVKDFHKKTANYFSSLKDEDHLCDITLVSDDDILIPAHKVILSVSSKFFSDLIRKFKERNPLIYLWGVKSRDLQNILSYIYNGQVEVAHQELDSFLNVARKLKIDGLTQSLNEDEDLELEEDSLKSTEKKNTYDKFTVNNVVVNNPTIINANVSNIQKPSAQNESKPVVLPRRKSTPIKKIQQEQTGKQSVIDVGIKDLFVNSGDGFVCKKCGEIFVDEGETELHFEVHWGDLNCKHCGKVYGGNETPSNHKHVYTFFNKYLIK